LDDLLEKCPGFSWDRVNFLPVAAVLWIQYEKNVDNTLMFLAVAKKSKTFFSFPCLANKQVCRSWEGAQPGSQPKLADGNIPYHGRHAQFMNGGWLKGRNPQVLQSLLGMAIDHRVVRNCIVHYLFCIFVVIIIIIILSSFFCPIKLSLF